MSEANLPTGLYVALHIYVRPDGTKAPEGPCVCLHQASRCGRGYIAGPYASARDAEIGRQSLASCGLDWSKSPEELRDDAKALGGRDFIRRIAYENLPF